MRKIKDNVSISLFYKVLYTLSLFKMKNIAVSHVLNTYEDIRNKNQTNEYIFFYLEVKIDNLQSHNEK